VQKSQANEAGELSAVEAQAVNAESVERVPEVISQTGEPAQEAVAAVPRSQAGELPAVEAGAVDAEAVERVPEVSSQAGEAAQEAVALPRSQVVEQPAVERQALEPEALEPEALQPEALQPEALEPEELKPEALKPEAMERTTEVTAGTEEPALEAVAVQTSQALCAATRGQLLSGFFEERPEAEIRALEPEASEHITEVIGQTGEPEAVAGQKSQATPPAIGRHLPDEGTQIKAVTPVQRSDVGSQMKATPAACAPEFMDEGSPTREISLAQATPAAVGTQDKIQDMEDEPKQETEIREGGEKIDESQHKDAEEKAEQHPEQQLDGEPQQQQQQQQPESNSNPTAEFVHLLGVDANGTHDPQVFRMKRDQPLKRLANTYATFRGLGAAAGEQLRMSTPGKDGLDPKDLDPQATVNSLGLADGDWVTFALVAGSESLPVPGDAAAVPPPQATGTGASVRRQEEPEQPRAKRRKQMPVPEEPGLKQPKKPLTGYFMWLGDNREAIVAASCSSHWSPALSKEAGLRWKNLSAVDKAPYETRAAEARADYDQALADYVAQGGVVKKRGQKDTMVAEQPAKRPKKEPMPKRPWGGAFGVFLAERREEFRKMLPDDCKLGDVTRAASETWKALPDDEKRAYEDVYARNLEDHKKAMEEYRRRHCADPEVPPTPPGLMRQAAVTSGPAKGWKVKSWRSRRGGLKWLIIQPGRGGRSFNNFNELKGGVVDTEVYSQLYNAVRPGLLRRMNERDSNKGRVETPGKRRPGQCSDDTPFKTRRGSPPAPAQPPQRSKMMIAPAPAVKPLADLDWSMMATQAFRPPSKGVNCLAHLVRHSRCAPSAGQLQPAEIHLKDYIMVGRGETCDVILGSSRTPQMLSRNHAAIKRDGNSFTLIDQGSMNGVLVNGEPVHNRHTLQVGDIVTFGVETETPEFDYVFKPLA